MAGKMHVKEIRIGTQMIGEGGETGNVATIDVELRKTG
jgi:DNA-binding protein